MPHLKKVLCRQCWGSIELAGTDGPPPRMIRRRVAARIGQSVCWECSPKVLACLRHEIREYCERHRARRNLSASELRVHLEGTLGRPLHVKDVRAAIRPVDGRTVRLGGGKVAWGYPWAELAATVAIGPEDAARRESWTRAEPAEGVTDL